MRRGMSRYTATEQLMISACTLTPQARKRHKHTHSPCFYEFNNSSTCMVGMMDIHVEIINMYKRTSLYIYIHTSLYIHSHTCILPHTIRTPSFSLRPALSHSRALGFGFSQPFLIFSHMHHPLYTHNSLLLFLPLACIIARALTLALSLAPSLFPLVSSPLPLL